MYTPVDSPHVTDPSQLRLPSPNKRPTPYSHREEVLREKNKEYAPAHPPSDSSYYSSPANSPPRSSGSSAYDAWKANRGRH